MTATTVRKKRPYLFVNQIDIRPRGKQFRSVFEPVLVVSHDTEISGDQITDEITIEEITIPTAEESSTTLVTRAYSKAHLARHAIYHFFQSWTIITNSPENQKDQKSVSTTQTEQISDILPLPDLANYRHSTTSAQPQNPAEPKSARLAFNYSLKTKIKNLRLKLAKMLIHDIQA